MLLLSVMSLLGLDHTSLLWKYRKPSHRLIMGNIFVNQVKVFFHSTFKTTSTDHKLNSTSLEETFILSTLVSSVECEGSL